MYKNTKPFLEVLAEKEVVHQGNSHNLAHYMYVIKNVHGLHGFRAHYLSWRATQVEAEQQVVRL